MIHIEINNRAACQKRFTQRTAIQRNYETTTKERFMELLKQQPDYCCKKCAKLI